MRLSWPKSAPAARRPGWLRPPTALSTAAFRRCSAPGGNRQEAVGESEGSAAAQTETWIYPRPRAAARGPCARIDHTPKRHPILSEAVEGEGVFVGRAYLTLVAEAWRRAGTNGFLPDPRKSCQRCPVALPSAQAGDVSEGGLAGRARHRASLADVRTAAAARHRLRERVQRARFPARLRGLWHPHSLATIAVASMRATWSNGCSGSSMPVLAMHPGSTGRSVADRDGYPGRAARSPEFRRPRAVRGARRDRSAICSRIAGTIRRRRRRNGRNTAGIFRVSEDDPARVVLAFSARAERQAFAAGRQHVRVGPDYSPWLGTLVPRRDRLSRLEVRYDPRDVSHIYVRDPETREFRSVGRRDGRLAPMTLWEHEGDRTRSTRRERAIGHGEGEVSAPDRRDRRRIEAVEGRSARRRAPDPRGGGRQAR